MTEDAKIGGASGKFPATRWSAILAARSKDPVEHSRSNAYHCNCVGLSGMARLAIFAVPLAFTFL
jgi:hypothetical protein